MSGSPIFGKFYTVMMLKKFFEAGLIRRIVDVGAGSGTYRDLLADDARGAFWIAIEAWGPNIETYGLMSRYDRVLARDAREVDFAELAPDLVLFGDVLEHMSKEEAQRTVARAVAAAPYTMISIPIIHYPQGEEEGNPYQRHVKDDWSHNEVCDSFDDLVTCLVHDHIGVYFLSRQARAVELLIRVHDVVSPYMVEKFGPEVQFSSHV